MSHPLRTPADVALAEDRRATLYRTLDGLEALRSTQLRASHRLFREWQRADEALRSTEAEIEAAEQEIDQL